ncbi:hypothetical protein H4R20_002224 [Coemansia guatemalensis]|uniref:CCHC-type domain-containing protein n=1 Tax=Coemansia guatemalensis TaxID=2761395 RepID=A0A9W8LTT1_9FUNG|nr:hypothetical protein H4R20_002224 [Coemansia guatemalensis]
MSTKEASPCLGSTSGPELRGVDSECVLYLKFGPAADDDIRRRIMHHVRRVLSSCGAQRSENLHDSRRKRRRRDDDYSADRYGNGHGSTDRKRKRSLSELEESDYEQTTAATAEVSGSDRSITFYSQSAGFDLDTVRDDDPDTDIAFEHGTQAVIGLTNDLMQALGNPCFNCSIPGHDLRNCPMPLDDDRVEANKEAFREKGSGHFSSRFYLVAEEKKRTDEMRKMFRPGQPLSQELREALDLRHDDDVPAYIMNMYRYGYPPAYLGQEPGQDPMLACPISEPDLPSTPDLHVFADANDYDRLHNKPETQDAANSDSARASNSNSGTDEDGAISEGEADTDKKSAGGASDKQDRVCCIPLVKYPGLDLGRFDFDSVDAPGRPLYTSTPNTRASSRRGMSYCDSYYHGGGHGMDTYRGGYYYDNYSDQTPARYMSNSAYDDDWGRMLNGYYQTSHSGYTGANGYSTPSRANGTMYAPEDTQESRGYYYNDSYAEGQDMYPPPLLPSTSSPARQTAKQSPANFKRDHGSKAESAATEAPFSLPTSLPKAPAQEENEAANLSPAPANAQRDTIPSALANVDNNDDSDGELEDGECDMEVSE